MPVAAPASPLDPSVVYDLVVVGAGPVGLLSALGAAERGAQRVLVVDQTRDFAPAGSFLDLQPNGLVAARAACARACETIIARGRMAEAPVFRFVDTAGVTVNEIHRGTFAEPPVSLRWSVLQEVLLEALPDSVRVVTNHQLRDLCMVSSTGHSPPDCVRAEFVRDRRRKNPYVQWAGGRNDDDGTADPNIGGQEAGGAGKVPGSHPPAATDDAGAGEIVSVFGKMVIGADGVNSVARRCVYRDAGGWEAFANAEYTGLCTVVSAGNPDIDADIERKVTEKYLAKGRTMTFVVPTKERARVASPRILVGSFPPGRMPFSWIASFTASTAEHMARFGPIDSLVDHVLDGQREEGVSEEMIAVGAQMLKASDGKCKVDKRPLYVVPACHPPPYEYLQTATEVQKAEFPANFYRPWGWQRIALVGDALHAMPPSLAQGTSLGFEDVAELLPRIARTGVWDRVTECDEPSPSIMESRIERAVEDFRQERMSRVCLAQKATVNRPPEQDREGTEELRNKLHAFKPSLV